MAIHSQRLLTWVGTVVVALGPPTHINQRVCFALTVTLHICNSSETLASVPNSSGILIFSRTKRYAYGLATVKTSYLLNVSYLAYLWMLLADKVKSHLTFLSLFSTIPGDLRTLIFASSSSSTQHKF